MAVDVNLHLYESHHIKFNLHSPNFCYFEVHLDLSDLYLRQLVLG